MEKILTQNELDCIFKEVMLEIVLVEIEDEALTDATKRAFAETPVFGLTQLIAIEAEKLRFTSKDQFVNFIKTATHIRESINQYANKIKSLANKTTTDQLQIRIIANPDGHCRISASQKIEPINLANILIEGAIDIVGKERVVISAFMPNGSINPEDIEGNVRELDKMIERLELTKQAIRGGDFKEFCDAMTEVDSKQTVFTKN